MNVPNQILETILQKQTYWNNGFCTYQENNTHYHSVNFLKQNRNIPIKIPNTTKKKWHVLYNFCNFEF